MSGNLTIEKISNCFHLPISEAAKELEVCATILKKFCRSKGILRWPHRKFKSLQNLINIAQRHLQQTSDESERLKYRSEIESYQSKIEYLTIHPNVSFKEIIAKEITVQIPANRSPVPPVEFEDDEEACELLVNLSTDNYSAIPAPRLIHKTVVTNSSCPSSPENSPIEVTQVHVENDSSPLEGQNEFTSFSLFHLPLKKAILEREKQKRLNDASIATGFYESDQPLGLSSPSKLMAIDQLLNPSASLKRRFDELTNEGDASAPQKFRKFWENV